MNRDSSNYFAREAHRYSKRSAGVFWKWLRNREARVILSILEPLANERILDAGCGSGFYTDLIRQHGANPVATDAVAEMAVAARTNTGAPVVVSDLQHPPFGRSFDRIVCAGALEFMHDPFAAVAAMADILSPSGPSVLVLHFPSDNLTARIYRRFHNRHGIKVRLFSETDCAKFAEHAVGFSIDAHRHCLFNHVMRLKRNTPQSI